MGQEEDPRSSQLPCGNSVNTTAIVGRGVRNAEEGNSALEPVIEVSLSVASRPALFVELKFGHYTNPSQNHRLSCYWLLVLIEVFWLPELTGVIATTS